MRLTHIWAVATVVIAMMVLIPPWIEVQYQRFWPYGGSDWAISRTDGVAQISSIKSAGYHPIFAPPWEADEVRLDTTRLSIQMGTTVFLTIAFSLAVLFDSKVQNKSMDGRKPDDSGVE